MKNIQNRIRRIINNNFFVSVFKVGSGQMISQMLALISVPILSRIYSNTAYGDTALIVSTAVILIDISAFGLSSAVMAPEDDEEAKAVFTTAFLTNFVICTAVTLSYALLQSRLQLFELSGNYGISLLLMWLYCIVYSNSSLLTVYSNRKGKYNKLFLNPIIGALANFVIAIPLGLMGLGFIGFMLTYIVQYLLCCIHMAWGDIPFKKRYKLSDFKKVVVKYREYILFQYPANFINNFGLEYPTQFLGRAFTTQQLSGYSMCIRVMAYPIRLIAAPVSTVYFKTATEYHRAGKNLAEFTYSMISKILLLSLIPVAVFIFVSEDLFMFVLGDTWQEAGQIAGFMIVQYVLLFCTQTTGYCRVAIGKQKANLLVSLVCLVTGLVFCTAGYSMFGTMMGTIFGYSVGQCVYNIFDMTVNFMCMEKKYAWKYMALSLVYVIFMFGVIILKYAVL